MWKKPANPIRIDPSQVVIGLFIWIDLPWDDHPFLYGRFKVRDSQQIETIRSLNLSDRLYYFPEKSDCDPGPVTTETPHEAPAATPPEEESVSMRQLAAEKKAHQERAQARRDAAARADRAWESTARATREAMLAMARTPKMAGKQLLQQSQEAASVIAEGGEILLHLLGDKHGEGPQFHALNVMTLSLLLGKSFGMSKDNLAELALGALCHDIGKARIPAHLLTARNRSRHEEQFYREHVGFGVQLAEESGAFGPTARAILAEHHERLDGSGWPARSRQLNPAAAIVALVNRYDRLCSPESPAREALMPAEALSKIYRDESGLFDKFHLALLVKLLGVYPPGTLVRLNDDSLGLVVSPGKETLKPIVLLYDPEVDKRDAPTLDLAFADGLKIEEALKPASLPPDVLAWINPRQRLSYFFSADRPA